MRLPIVFAELTVQNNKDYVKSIGVLALPTIQFYANGQKQDTFPCGPSKVPILKKKMAQFVNENVDPKTLKLNPPAEDPMVAATPSNDTGSKSQEKGEGKEDTALSVAEREKSRLRIIPYFSGMLESEFESTVSKAKLLTFESGSIIMREGNVGRTFYVIVEGEVEICQKTSFEDPLTTPPTYCKYHKH